MTLSLTLFLSLSSKALDFSLGEELGYINLTPPPSTYPQFSIIQRYNILPTLLLFFATPLNNVSLPLLPS
jgi:hypothetical protein